MTQPIQIRPGEVHFQLGDIGPSCVFSAQEASVLSEIEQRRAAAFVTEALRARYTAAVILLRSVLAHYLSCLPQEVRFNTGPHGKPYIDMLGVKPLQFNFSHSHERALVALALQHEIGVDIEYHQKPISDILSLAKRFFAPTEYQALAQLQAQDRPLAFYRLWTRKEAFIKATGQGLFLGLDQFTVSTQEEGMDCLLTVDGHASPAQQWRLGSISQVEQGYTAAFAVQSEVSKLCFAHWPLTCKK